MIKPSDLDRMRDRFGEKVRVDVLYSEEPLMMFSLDCFLFCLHPVIFHIFNLPGSIRLFVMVTAWRILTTIRCCELPMVRYFHRILEEAGDRPCGALGCTRSFESGNQKAGFQVREDDQGSCHWGDR